MGRSLANVKMALDGEMPWGKGNVTLEKDGGSVPAKGATLDKLGAALEKGMGGSRSG